MRRLAILTLASAVATTGVLAVTAAPAWAHICPRPVEIAVGQPSTIDVGVTVENATIPDVEIDIPAGLTLNRVDPLPGWTFARTGAVLRITGGPIDPFQCAYFSLGVTAPAKGTFGIPVTERTADGTVFARTTPDPTNADDRVLDQFVYAGVKPPSPSSGFKLPSAPVLGGIVLVGFGVVMVAFLGIRSWRDRRYLDDDDDDQDDPGDNDVDAADRDAELQARLEQFKKRRADPQPRD